MLLMLSKLFQYCNYFLLLKLIFFLQSCVFAHLPSVDYLESEDCVVKDPIATRQKPLGGIGCALLVRERLDDLQMDVIVWCPYEEHRGVTPFTEQTLFLWLHQMQDGREALSFKEGAEVVLAMYRQFYASNLLVIRINFMIRHGQSCNNISFLWAMLYQLGILGLAPLLFVLILQGFSPLCHSIKGQTATMWSCMFTAHPHIAIVAAISRLCTGRD